MFNKLLRLFSRKPAAPNPPAGGSPFAQLAWIEAGKSPFKVRMLDCRSFSRSMLATTGDPQQIALFSFSQYGRRASYATYEDTTKLGR